MAFGALTNWFKKRVEDVRDVFDANTVKDQQKRLSAGQPRYYQDQQKAIQNPGPGKRPDYGTGFAGVRNAFRDVFDANTAQDRFSRLSVGQPENYFDQQKFLNERSLQAPEQRSTVQQIGYNVAGGLSDIAKAPGALLDAKASFDRTKVGKVLNIANPMNTGQNIVNTVNEQLRGQKLGTSNEQLNQFLQKTGRQSQDVVENKVQQSRLGQRQTDNKLVSGVSRAVGNLAGQVGSAVASGGSTLPSAAMGAITFSDQQKRAKEAGKTDEEAFNIGAVQGGIQAVLEKAGLDMLKLPGAGNVATRAGKRFLTEGAQEGTQQFAQNVITNKTYDPSQSLTEGVKESALYGGIAGGVAGSAFDIKPGQVQETGRKLIQPNAATQELAETRKRLQRQYDSANSVATKRQIGSAIQKVNEEIRRINQKGFALVPNIRRQSDPQQTPESQSLPQDGAKLLSSQASQDINDTFPQSIDTLESLKQEARKYKTAEEFVKAIQDGKVEIPKGSPETIAKLQKELGMNWDSAYKTPDGVANMQKKVIADLYNQALKEGQPKAKNTIPPELEAKPPANAFQDTLPSGKRPDSVREVVKRGGNPLFHDTDARGVIGILDSGEIRTSQAPFSQIAGQGKRVSTTRNFDNYSRYHDSPYRFVLDETKTGQKSVPDNREEFESIFKKNVKTDSVETLAIDITNPALIKDMNNGRLAEVIAKAKEKGIRIEPFEGKILPDEYANKEIQQLTRERFLKDFGQATQPTKGAKASPATTKVENATKEQKVDFANYVLSNIRKHEQINSVGSVLTNLRNKDYPYHKEIMQMWKKWSRYNVGKPTAEAPVNKLPQQMTREEIAKTGVMRVGDTDLPTYKTDGVIGDTKPLKKGNVRPDAMRTQSGYTVQYEQYKQGLKRANHIEKRWNEQTKEAAINEARHRNDSMNLAIFEHSDNYGDMERYLFGEEINGHDLKLTYTGKTREFGAAQSATQPTKGASTPRGFILAETKGRGGRKDTVRIMADRNGKLKSTVQSEDATVVDPIADALGITKEMVDSYSKDQSGTIQALDRVKNSGNNMLKDMQDQKDYGVKDIQEAPTNTIDDVLTKYLETEEFSPQQLAESNPKNRVVGALTGARESVRKTNVLRLANDKIAQGLEKGSRGNRASRGFVRALQYINKNAGQDPEMIKAAQKYAGENTYADSALLEVGSKAYSLVPTEQSRARVHAVLDPESADGAIKFEDLTPQEQQASQILRDLGDAINDTSYRNKFISKKKWESNRGGRYIARLYNEVATAEDVADLLEMPDKRGLHLGMYKSRTELNDDLRQRLIRDPIKLAVIRARQVRQNEALLQYMTTAESRGYVTSTPRSGFVKVTPENRMANWAGRYVRQDVYENIEGFRAMGKGINALNNLLDVYDGNPLRRMRKKLLTIYNPVVRTGNITSNYFFAYLNGVNPVTFQKNKVWAKGLLGMGTKGSAMNRKDPLFIAAQKSGLIGNDIVRTDKNIFNKDKQFLTDLEKNTQSTFQKIKSVPSKFDDALSRRYGNADDVAKLSALKSHVDRGIPIDRAIEMTRRGFQDYSRVGHLYDMAAKSPVFGNAFIRFQGDLYTNIIKNAAVDHPVRLGSLVLATAALGEALSNLSGESDEDKKTREDRAGAPKIPFTNISTEFQTPLGAIDLARFTPLYMRQDVDGNSVTDNLSRISPINVFNPFNTSKEEVIRKAATDPLIGPIISTVFDTDWRGKSVSDPDGVRDGKQLFPDDPLTSGEKNRNRLQYGLRSYLPYPANEIGDILAALNQNKRNEQTSPGTKGDPSVPGARPLDREGFNTSGSKKTTGQALARLFGVRAEKFGADEAQQKRELDELFDFFDKQDEFKNTLDSETKKAFENRHNSTRTRSGIQEEFENDPWWKYKSAAELLENPKLFDAEEKYAKLQNEFDGKPIDPIFDLEKDKRNIVLAKKMKLPGSKDEGFNKLYDEEWYQDFRQKQDAYYKEKRAYNKSRGFKDQESDNPYPEANRELQKAMDVYFALPKGTGERSAFIRNNPETWAAITAQWDKQNAWTDKEREKLGLPKIDREEFNGFSYGKSGSKRGGRKKGKGVKLPGFSTANAPNNLKIKVANPKAPSTKLRVVQPIKAKKRRITIAKQAKKIKKT